MKNHFTSIAICSPLISVSVPEFNSAILVVLQKSNKVLLNFILKILEFVPFPTNFPSIFQRIPLVSDQFCKWPPKTEMCFMFETLFIAGISINGVGHSSGTTKRHQPTHQRWNITMLRSMSEYASLKQKKIWRVFIFPISYYSHFSLFSFYFSSLSILAVTAPLTLFALFYWCHICRYISSSHIFASIWFC